MKFKFFHTPKPRQFEYIPRFYDPEKEEREERKKALLGDNYKDAYQENGEKQEYEPGQYVGQLHLRRGIIARKEKAARRQTRTLRTVIFLILLIAIGYWLIAS